ncbi:hypothetical protein K2Z83_12800 [Oscillochloris sp. ZM17-4]|uniref:hypothetical protein n=1 Tax=Oscillochloris sp. ZM17-4 TaxID=2866714 RepID=UPI001C73D667|nr:hypothetical protein [Oscillochloris sp. ZM17-4]MBX0328556.1 hypothetical protein [Oscillochloris sp. ZM17-4]
MGHRDSQLTPDDALATAEAETRRLLARYGEPSVADPPADLARRVIDGLSDLPPAHPTSRLRQIYGGVIGVCMIALLSLGVWGVLLDSSGPAHLFGDMGGGLSQLLLLLTLAAKPLINLLLTAGAATMAVIVAIIGGSWLWWQLLRRELSASLEAGV